MWRIFISAISLNIIKIDPLNKISKIYDEENTVTQQDKIDSRSEIREGVDIAIELCMKIGTMPISVSSIVSNNYDQYLSVNLSLMELFFWRNDLAHIKR